MRTVPRHEFVPARARADAYADGPLPIGHGQTISQPYVVALMTELAAVKPGDRVLEIGTGSGYQAAILSRLARTVYSLERIAELARAASSVLRALGYQNVSVKTFDGTYGYPAAAPYDRILVTAGASDVPEPLLAQLAVGGKLIVPIGPPERQRIRVIRRRKDHFAQEDGEDVVFVPLVGRFGRAAAL
jgi:protein-L-isoaspartate(D-aspartate) O-methyltransferase